MASLLEVEDVLVPALVDTSLVVVLAGGFLRIPLRLSVGYSQRSERRWH